MTRRVVRRKSARQCRNCGAQVSKARWDTGRDYCLDAVCIDVCAPRREYKAVGVHKSIPQIVPADTVDSGVASSGHRRA